MFNITFNNIYCLKQNKQTLSKHLSSSIGYTVLSQRAQILLIMAMIEFFLIIDVNENIIGKKTIIESLFVNRNNVGTR